MLGKLLADALGMRVSHFAAGWIEVNIFHLGHGTKDELVE